MSPHKMRKRAARASVRDNQRRVISTIEESTSSKPIALAMKAAVQKS